MKMLLAGLILLVTFPAVVGSASAPRKPPPPPCIPACLVYNFSTY